MISTNLTIGELKRINYLDSSGSDFQKIEEPDNSLPDRVIFKRGDWFQGWINLEKLEIDSNDINFLKKNHSKYNRIKGIVTIRLKVTDYLTRGGTNTGDLGLGDFIKLFQIEVQVGITDESQILVYVAPNTVFEELQNKYESFINIQTQNIKLGIKHEEVDSWIIDLKNILDQLNLEIDNRIQKIK